MPRARFVAALVVAVLMQLAARSDEPPTLVGVASVDITPAYPVRLSGYGSRRAESEGIEQHIFAKALAIGTDADLCVLITVDNLGVPESMSGEIARRLKIPREH